MLWDFCLNGVVGVLFKRRCGALQWDVAVDVAVQRPYGTLFNDYTAAVDLLPISHHLIHI